MFNDLGNIVVYLNILRAVLNKGQKLNTLESLEINKRKSYDEISKIAHLDW